MSTEKQLERRGFTLAEFRVSDDDAGAIEGHAAVFGQLSEDLGGFREKVAPGAFSQTITADDIRALFNHDPNFVLGRNRSGTLTLAEDERGLAIKVTPPKAQWATDLRESIRRKDITQMSFGFVTLDELWEKVDGQNIRTLKTVRLFDVSPVTFPAYPQTDVAVRALERFQAEPVSYAHYRNVLALLELED